MSQQDEKLISNWSSVKWANFGLTANDWAKYWHGSIKWNWTNVKFHHLTDEEQILYIQEQKSKAETRAAERRNEVNQNMSKSTIQNIFWWEEKQSFWSALVAQILIFPYRILTYFIQFLWFLLIPYQTVKDYTKEIFPVAFALAVLLLLMVNGVYISIENIDNLLFETSFFPFIWWIWQVLLVGMLSIWILYTYKTINNWSADYMSVQHFQSKTAKLITIILVIWILVVYPIATALLQNSTSWSLISITASSLFWYACYLVYLFVISTALYTIFKRTLYLVFSILNKEYEVSKKQIKDILFSLAIVFFLNWFLSIRFIMF